MVFSDSLPFVTFVALTVGNNKLVFVVFVFEIRLSFFVALVHKTE